MWLWLWWLVDSGIDMADRWGGRSMRGISFKVFLVNEGCTLERRVAGMDWKLYNEIEEEEWRGEWVKFNMLESTIRNCRT